MPNLDAGHYFLTVLAPIRTDTLRDPTVGRSRSHRHMLAQKLALMATGRQTAASPSDAWPSPFSKNTRNHLVRLVIIDQPAYNGRVSGNTLVGLIRGVNPLVAQPVDRLSSPFLLFAAEVDARDPLNAEADLRAYTDELWATMRDDLTVIFGHCIGFEKVTTADAFYTYLKRCQIETTMPFNDYWPDALQAPPIVPIKAYGGGAVAVSVVLALGALYFGWGWWALLVFVGALAVAIFALYRFVLSSAARPYPIAPGSDLPSVLKSLFVQQQFTRLAIEVQGLDDQALHARFGAFLTAVAPRDLVHPTLPAGTVAGSPAEWAA